MITVVIADDHAVVREGLAMLMGNRPDIDVVGQAADGAEAVAVARDTAPDVVLMDLSMPVLDGVAATRQLYEELPGIAVVVLTTFADSDRVLDSLEAGAVGYLMKDSPPGDIIAGVVAAANGGSVGPTGSAGARRGAAPRPGAQRVGLPDCEADRSPGVCPQGMSNRQIARQLSISEKTVKSHLTTVYGLLGVTDRVQAAVWAQRHLRRGR